jgi:ubiquinol-cytochrome c reductase cytochrome b subunit
LAIVILHLALLHSTGSSNPLGAISYRDNITFLPYFAVKDVFIFLIFLIFFCTLLYFYPNLLGHSDNYIPANPLLTPAHIVPEWYFLPFYAILRAIPNKLGGVLAMVGAIVSLGFLSVLTSSNYNVVKSSRFFPIKQIIC